MFIGNISFSCQKEDIEKLFSDCGEIREIRIPLNHEGKPRGFAHVEYEKEGSVEKALKKDGMELCGRAIRVDMAGKKQSGRFDDRSGGRRKHYD